MGLLLAPGDTKNTNVYQVTIKARSTHSWEYKKETNTLAKEKLTVSRKCCTKIQYSEEFAYRPIHF